jgi:uncharacterized protein
VSSTIEILEGVVRERMAVLGETVHSFEHVGRVLRTATFLAEQEKADLELVQVGALLHDIGWVVGQPHHENGAELANEILKEIGYPEERRERVVKIVLHHDLDFRDKLETLEERIVWDADKIDILGILGIVRTFHWLGKSSFASVVRGAFEKLTAIYPQLNTKTAKAIAEERHKETLTLLVALREELSLRDLQLFSRPS